VDCAVKTRQGALRTHNACDDVATRLKNTMTRFLTLAILSLMCMACSQAQIAPMPTTAPRALPDAPNPSPKPLSYAERIRARFLPNIIFKEPVDGNPTAEMKLRIAADGSIVDAKLVKPSGSQAWDEAVQKAVTRTERIPLDMDGRVPEILVLTFQPKR
jgi:hypothetical protein